jgi:hypothetical protein
MTDAEKIEQVECVLDGICPCRTLCDGSDGFIEHCYCPTCKVCGKHLPVCFDCGALQPHGWYCHD